MKVRVPWTFEKLMEQFGNNITRDTHLKAIVEANRQLELLNHDKALPEDFVEEQISKLTGEKVKHLNDLVSLSLTQSCIQNENTNVYDRIMERVQI